MQFFVLSTLVLVLVLPACSREDSPSDYYTEWRSYLGDPSSSQYSALDQINLDNVAQLEVVWTYRTGDRDPDNRSQIQCNPIIINGVLFGTSPRLKVFALDAATGEEIWVFDPFADDPSNARSAGVNRGVMYWESGSDRRIFFTAGPHLLALDADAGNIIREFGRKGIVDLRENLGRDVSDLYIAASSPGVVFEDLLIMGSRMSEGAGAAPGHIRAFDVRSGELRWIFHTIPHPGEFGYDTWPEDAWQKSGAANNWSGMSLDEERGIVFIPTGSPAFDFWGGDRKGKNLFGNSVLALNARTGERIWHFQTVHHDLWDRDLPAPPNLVTVEHDGVVIDAVAQITKSGLVFLLDRETGEPLFPVEERPVPSSDLKGEEAWPTQPFPLKPPPFARWTLEEEDITDITPEAHEWALERFRRIRKGEQFIPPSTEGTLIFPGFDGGGEWGGAAADPSAGILYVNSNEMPWILTMVEIPSQEGVDLGKRTYTMHCTVCHGIDREGDPQNTYPSLQNLRGSLEPSEIMEIIEGGKGVMPSFAHLPGEEKEALVAHLLDLRPRRSHRTDQSSGGPESPSVPYSHTGYNRFIDADGYPAIKPPWGRLNAIDLNSGEILWQVPLGEFPELTARGIPQTGTENYGGPVVTAGRLIFIAASKDERFRAFNKETGEVVWETRLPAGGYATPATYQVNGRQYVVIAAGGGKMGTKSGDYYIAFALPED